MPEESLVERTILESADLYCNLTRGDVADLNNIPKSGARLPIGRTKSASVIIGNGIKFEKFFSSSSGDGIEALIGLADHPALSEFLSIWKDVRHAFCSGHAKHGAKGRSWRKVLRPIPRVKAPIAAPAGTVP